MHIDLNALTSPGRQNFDQEQLKPGSIWELSRCVQSPLKFSSIEQQSLYSDSARRFLNGNSPPRYVMTVKEAEPAVQDEDWQIVFVMLLSVQTEFLSNVDLVIPSKVSGVGQDLLAQTWHILPMLARNLSHPVGQRLTREVYEVLLSVGDYHHGLVDEAPSRQEIQSSGLKVGAVWAEQQPEIQAFHQQEEAWSDVLQVPLAAYHTYLKTTKITEAILDEALQLEQFLEVAVEVLDEVNAVPGGNLWENVDQSKAEPHDTTVTDLAIAAPNRTRLLLSQWLQNLFDAGWQTIEDFWGTQTVSLALGSRSGDRSNEINSDYLEEILTLINQLSPGQDERKHRQAAKRLGEIGTGNSNAIQALVNLLRTSQDDETLWTAVESLWQIDPGNPAAGVSRVKLIDLGMQLAGHTLALAVALLKKADQQVGVLLRVYPTGNEAYLPTNLKLILLDESEQILREVTARRADIYIQIKLSGQPGEQFSVRVALGDASITEDFVV